MMTSAQLRAARALLGIDQKTLAERAGVSVPTIQRMEASQGNVRGVVDSLSKVVEALKFGYDREFLGELAPSARDPLFAAAFRLETAPAGSSAE